MPPVSPQKRILNAARQAFIEHGKDGARVDAIARRARVNKAMIYYYFSSKDQLYYQVFKTAFSLIMQRVSGALEQKTSPPDQIHAMINAYHSFLLENNELPRMILREIADGAPVLKKVISEELSTNHRGLILRFVQTLHQGYVDGSIKQVNPQHTLISLMGMIIFPFIASPLLENLLGTQAEGDFWQRRPDEIFDLLFHGIQPRVAND
jgi:TetR/AcrR family transcriptional regulator